MTAKMIAESRRFFPITPNIRQVDAFNNYTAGCGHAFATSSGFRTGLTVGLLFADRLVICSECTMLKEKGSGFESTNAFSLVASADEWFSPIVAEVGPDGYLWFADWYNFIIQHNPIPV